MLRTAIGTAALALGAGCWVVLKHSDGPVPKDSYLHAATDMPVKERRTGALIHVLGVSHNSSRSVSDVRALCEATGQVLAGVAVELDSDTASYLLPCIRALNDHTLDHIKDNGEKVVQEQLFKSDTIHQQAAQEGKVLTSSNQIVVPSLLKESLRDGVIWGQEMVEAIDYASSRQLAVAFVDLPPTLKAKDAATIPAIEYLASALVHGQSFTLNLFHRCTQPALGDAGLQQVMEVDMQRRAMREYQPTAFEVLVGKRDRYIANSVSKMCVDREFDSNSHIVLVIGKMHVPGVCKSLTS